MYDASSPATATLRHAQHTLVRVLHDLLALLAFDCVELSGRGSGAERERIAVARLVVVVGLQDPARQFALPAHHSIKRHRKRVLVERAFVQPRATVNVVFHRVTVVVQRVEVHHFAHACVLGAGCSNGRNMAGLVEVEVAQAISVLEERGGKDNTFVVGCEVGVIDGVRFHLLARRALPSWACRKAARARRSRARCRYMTSSPPE